MAYRRCSKGHQLTPSNIYLHQNSPKSNNYKYERVSKWCRRCMSDYHKDMKTRDPEQYARKVAYGKKYFQLNPAQVLFQNAKKRAEIRKCKFTITLAWIRKRLKAGVCEVTGIPFEYKIGPFRPSLDRRNNSKGYTVQNCQLVCAIYNFAKRNFTHADVVKMAKFLTRR